MRPYPLALFATLSLSTLVTAPRSAAADAPSAADLASARDLFVAAERDEDAGRWADALEKLRRVAQVKSTAGVRYHVALCEEHLGRLAGALEDFEAARSQAHLENARDVLLLVGARVAELTPRVPRIAVRVPLEAQDPTVTLDGAPVELARLGEPLPVDPGEHRLGLVASGRRAATAKVALKERDAVVIDLPLGEPLPAAKPAPSEPPIPAAAASPAPVVEARPPPIGEGPHRPAPVAAITASTAAVVLAGAGVASFVVAGSAHDGAVRDCAAVVSAAPNACDAKKDPVRTWDWVAIGAWSAAAVGAGAAIYLWTHAPGPARSAASVRAVVGPASVALAGSF
jgi:hypothetical protein